MLLSGNAALATSLSVQSWVKIGFFTAQFL